MTIGEASAAHSEVVALRAALDSERAARATADAALRRSEELVAALPLVVCACSGAEHTVEMVTGTLSTALAGLRVGTPAREAFGAVDCQRWLAPMDRVLASGKSIRISALPCGEVSAEYFFDVQYLPRQDEHGKLVGVLWTAVDVTYHVRACLGFEAAWHEANMARRAEAMGRARLTRTLEQAPFGVAILEGQNHEIRLMNEAQRRRIGAMQREGLTMRQTFPEPALTSLHDTLQAVYRTGNMQVLREQPLGWERTSSSSGEHAYLDTFYHPVRSDSGEVEAIVVFSVDVSEGVRARQAAAAAREQADATRERLRNVLAAVPAAICLVTGPEFVFEYANPAYESLAPGRQLIGRTVAEVFEETDSSASLARMQRVFATGEIEYTPEVCASYDRNLTGRASEAFFSTVLGPLRKPDGQIVGVVAATLDVTQQVRQRERLSALHHEAEAARDALQREKSLLAARIAERTAELAQTNSALAAEINDRTRAETQLRELLQRLATAREDEQRRVARDLHDQVGQTLTALTLAVQAVRSDSTLSAQTTTRLVDLQQLADGLALEVHSLAVRLRPTVLDDHGLQAAVAQLLSDFSTRCQVVTDFQTAGLDLARLPSEIETVLYRVVQEALTNVARHALASHVTVIIERRPGFVVTIVEDNGIGCDPEDNATDARLGWLGMRERALSVNGSLDIESELGRGTTVIASVPISTTQPPRAAS